MRSCNGLLRCLGAVRQSSVVGARWAPTLEARADRRRWLSAAPGRAAAHLGEDSGELDDESVYLSAADVSVSDIFSADLAEAAMEAGDGSDGGGAGARGEWVGGEWADADDEEWDDAKVESALRELMGPIDYKKELGEGFGQVLGSEFSTAEEQKAWEAAVEAHWDTTSNVKLPDGVAKRLGLEGDALAAEVGRLLDENPTVTGPAAEQMLSYMMDVLADRDEPVQWPPQELSKDGKWMHLVDLRRKYAYLYEEANPEEAAVEDGSIADAAAAPVAAVDEPAEPEAEDALQTDGDVPAEGDDAKPAA